MSSHQGQLIKDLIKFFEDRSLFEVASSLKEDLKINQKLNQANMLAMVRNAIT
jgi:hypothetical protein